MMTEETNVQVRWKEDMAFEGIDSVGRVVLFDAAPEVGGQDKGFRPLEMLLLAMAGCTAMDTILILKKMRQKVTDFVVHVSANRAAEHPKVYTNIVLEYVIKGTHLSKRRVKTAIELSTSKYCPAIAMLRQAASITTTYRIVEE